MLIVSVNDVSLRLGGRRILDGVSLDLAAGELVVLIGPNGAGKSSLLKLVAGEIPASDGDLRLCGHTLGQWSRRDLARRRAVVPQDTHLDFAFSAFDVVMIGRSPHQRAGVETAADHRAAWAALRRVDAVHLADRLYPTLSGGERQRVQIARALAQLHGDVPPGPRCLLLDEHTASLDPAHQHAMFDLARTVAAQGVGVLAVVHDLNLAAAYADRVGVMVEGRMIALGSPEETLCPAILDAAFGLSCMLTRNPLDGSLAVATASFRSMADNAFSSDARP